MARPAAVTHLLTRGLVGLRLGLLPLVLTVGLGQYLPLVVLCLGLHRTQEEVSRCSTEL